MTMRSEYGEHLDRSGINLSKTQNLGFELSRDEYYQLGGALEGFGISFNRRPRIISGLPRNTGLAQFLRLIIQDEIDPDTIRPESVRRKPIPTGATAQYQLKPRVTPDEWDKVDASYDEDELRDDELNLSHSSKAMRRLVQDFLTEVYNDE